jgi:hypothetical protein
MLSADASGPANGFKAVNAENEAKAGVSTKPRDGVFIELELRPRTAD